MGFEINGISSMQMLNTETGKSVDFGKPISVKNDIELQPDKQYMFSSTVNSSIEFSCDNTKFDVDGLSNLFTSKLENATYATMNVPIYKQARVHKRKRINKKWLKRYGYTIIMKSVKAKVIGISSDEFPIKTEAKLVLEFSQEDLKILCQS